VQPQLGGVFCRHLSQPIDLPPRPILYIHTVIVECGKSASMRLAVSGFRDRRRITMEEDTGSIPSAVSGSRSRETAEQLRQRALQASDRALAYTRDEPMKSLLIAAAAGALLMGLVSLMVRSDD
jgi:hypothetical protein